MNKIIYDFLQNEISSTEKQITDVEKRIEDFSLHENGRLRIHNSTTTPRYYIVNDKGLRVYLSPKNSENFLGYLQNYHDIRIIRKIKSWNQSCKEFLDALQKYDDKYNDIAPSVFLKVTTIVPDYEANAKKWEESSKFQMVPDHDYRIKTLRGDYVRSKSEALIADKLFLAGLHYRYESPLRIGKLTYYPDFQIMHPLNGEIYLWEHFGLLNDPNYATKMVEKIDSYSEIGFVLGKNFMASLETNSCPINIDLVEKSIETVFGVKVCNGSVAS